MPISRRASDKASDERESLSQGMILMASAGVRGCVRVDDMTVETGRTLPLLCWGWFWVAV